MKQGATVVDLDGTLVKGNTLKMYLRAGADISNFPLLCFFYLARKLRLINHEGMKYEALKVVGRKPELLEKFKRMVEKSFNSDVLSFLQERRDAGDRILLATAAADFYIPAIWDGEFLASPWGGPDLRGEIKKTAVEAWLMENNLKINYFLTDHPDDMPLVRFVEKNGGKVKWIK